MSVKALDYASPFFPVSYVQGEEEYAASKPIAWRRNEGQHFKDPSFVIHQLTGIHDV